MNLSSLKSLREKSTHKSLFGSVDKHGVVADQRSAHRREPRGHRQVVAADAVDNALVVGGGISIM